MLHSIVSDGTSHTVIATSEVAEWKSNLENCYPEDFQLVSKHNDLDIAFDECERLNEECYD